MDAGLGDAAELALSEVVTNAVLHAHTPFEIILSLAGGALRVEVADQNPQLPVQRDYAEQATTGRGMELVAACTSSCGVDSRGPAGKSVWFEVTAVADDARSGQDLLDAWGGADAEWPDAQAHAGRHEPTRADGAGTVSPERRTVRLLALPPTLWLAAREHHDAVLRELARYGAEHPLAVPGARQVAMADQARSWISARLIDELGLLGLGPARAHRALPSGHPSPLPDTPASHDLDLDVPADAAAAFGALQDVLDAAERLAAGGLLLARPALPEVVAVRDWACEQVISQLAGVTPTPWPGTGQERFLKQVGAPPPESDAWDVLSVSESDRGAVAADDAHRIVAVSRSLASALGWAVADLIGRRIIVLIPPELREAHVAGFTRHLTTGESHAIGVPLRLPVLRADGSRVDCAFLIERTPATAGRALYLAWIEPDPPPAAGA